MAMNGCSDRGLGSTPALKINKKMIAYLLSKNCMMRGCMIYLFDKYNYNYQVEDDEVVEACSANGGEEVRIYAIGRKAREKETTRKTKTHVGR
jgi:hypothetical protein